MRNAPVSIARAAAIIATAALCFTSLHAQVAPATQSATQPSADVDHLIKQLGSDSAQDRDEAQNQLVNIGSSAIPALKKAAENDDDPEIRSRSAAAISQMKDQDANQVTLITLHRKDAVATEVLDDIAAQAHFHFAGYAPGMAIGNGSHTVTVDADRKPFWDVMTDVCGQLNVCPQVDPPEHDAIRLFVAPRNWITMSPHQIVGPYWIGIASLNRTRNIDLSGPPITDDQFVVRLVVFPEPKLAVAQMSEFNLKEATDDAGNSMVPPATQQGFRHLLRGSMMNSRMIETRLAYPQNPGKKISILRGEVVVLLAQDIQHFQLDDVLTNPKVTTPLKNCAVQANVARQGTDIFRVTVQGNRQGLGDEQWAAMINRMNDLTLEDADGHPLWPLPISINGQATDTTFGFTAIFSKNAVGMGGIRPAMIKVGDPKRLTWNVAQSLKTVMVPVTFKDLPMP